LIVGIDSPAITDLTNARTAPLLAVRGADVRIRNVTFFNGKDIGLIAERGAILRLDGVTISGNKKGGLLIDSSAFEINNTSVIGNGPGFIMGFGWGGIRVQGDVLMPRRLTRVSALANSGDGVSCEAAVLGDGVMVTGTAQGIDVGPNCGFHDCGPRDTSCGFEVVAP